LGIQYRYYYRDHIKQNGRNDNKGDVVLRLKGTKKTDIYLMLDGDGDGNITIAGSKNHTESNYEGGYYVSIIAQGKDLETSRELVTIRESEEYRSKNWEGTGDDLVVKVCALPKTAKRDINIVTNGGVSDARILVYVDNANGRLSCDPEFVYKIIRDNEEIKELAVGWKVSKSRKQGRQSGFVHKP